MGKPPPLRLKPNQQQCVQRAPLQPRQPLMCPLRLQLTLHLLQEVEALPLPLPLHLSHDLPLRR